MNKTQFTPEVEAEISKRVEDELLNMVKVDHTRMIMFMLSHMGKMVVETNADTLDLSQDATINKERYKIKARITVKKLKPS